MIQTSDTTELVPISMQDAVGYPAMHCTHQHPLGDALVLKHERLFLLVNERGDIPEDGRCGLGLFRDDTRVLSRYELRFAAGEPDLLSAQLSAPYHAQIDLAMTDEAFGGDSWDPKNSIHIRRELVMDDRLVETVFLTNYLRRPVEVEVGLRAANDFADIFEVRGWKRPARGQFYRPGVEGDAIVFSYRGRDGALLRTRIGFSETVPSLDASGARWRLTLMPKRRTILRWEVSVESESVAPARVSAGALRERRSRLAEIYQEWRDECSAWHTDVAEFDHTLAQAVDDLRALHIQTGDQRIVSAGIPWYTTAFGRDSIITALQTLPLNLRIAVETLRFLAWHQGTREESYTEEQPGKIMHELRRGEMARSGEIPHVPYYGSIDATPLWLVLFHEVWRWTGDLDLVHELLPSALRALEWIDRYGDLDGDGFVEYARTSEKGLVNQGWKDSGDGVPFPDGSLPDPPIALVEVQGYVFDAKERMALLFQAIGETERSTKLRGEARVLRDRLRERFWVEELGTFALALDGEKRRLETVTTNAGHLLWSRVPTPEQARRMADVFTAPDMFSGWGIRTLSARHAVYNPMSYHNGSIWPHDNALVGLGLALFGHARATVPILESLHAASMNMRLHRLPELFCGMTRTVGMQPVLYPVSCSPQAWASGALFMLLQAALGLLPDAPRRVLHIREPRLPAFLREVKLSNFRVGDTAVSLQFRRHGKRTLANLLSLEGGPLQVRIELS
jgi:glycogen debranching enzyme